MLSAATIILDSCSAVLSSLAISRPLIKFYGPAALLILHAHYDSCQSNAKVPLIQS
jgi:hypothetical protein